MQLARRGFQVDVYEKRNEVEQGPSERSYPMGLTSRAIKGLDEAGATASAPGQEKKEEGGFTYGWIVNGRVQAVHREKWVLPTPCLHISLSC